MQPSLQHRTWAEIRTDAILHNCRSIRASLPSHTALIAVVKANAYGHGAAELAPALEEWVDYFMVAELSEAISLRRAGIRSPILIAGYTDPAYTPLLCQNHLTQCIFSLSYAREIQKNLPPSQSLRCHLKLDTGMGRLGLSTEASSLARDAKELLSLRGLEWEGLFTHFAQSELENDPYTKVQRQDFLASCELLREAGFSFVYQHSNNSAAALLGLHEQTNAVRVGLSLYGAYPSPYVQAQWLKHSPPLRPAMALKTRVISIRHLSPGDSVGYNRRFLAQEPATVAVLAAGYADGIPRVLSRSPGAPVIAPHIHLVGSVCMDMCFADISKCKESYRVGDTVCLFGDGVTADDWARHADTITYEIFCNLSSRVPRILI